MALATSTGALLEQIQTAEEVRDNHLEFLDDMVGRLHGSYWRADHADADYDYAPENVYFQYLSLMVPRMIFDNPGVRATSKRSGPQEDVAAALQSGLNRWVRDIGLRKILEQVAVDMLMTYGVMMVTEEERLDLSLPKALKDRVRKGVATWPVCRRVSPRSYIVDPNARTRDEIRFQGHEYLVDKDDLYARAKKDKDGGWNLDAISELSVYSRSKDLDSEETGGPRPYRNQVRIYELWIPEYEGKDHPGAKNGFHGSIFTLSVDMSVEADPGIGSGPGLYGPDGTLLEKDGKIKGKMVREPRPYYGPATGPYYVFGAYTVPDSVYPLSPLVATEGQINELNSHELAAAASMQNHKRLIAVKDHTTAERVKNLRHDFVFVADFDFNGKPMVEQVELGGATEDTLRWIERSRERVDRNLGMDDALRGNASGIGTATEHSIANESSSTRIAFLKQKFTDSTQGLLTAVASFMYYSDRVVFPIGEEDFGSHDPLAERWFEGGDEDIGSGYSFADLELSIEPYSMERSSEGLVQKRMLESHMILLNTLPVMQQFPTYPWREHFRKIGAAVNIPGLHELITEEFLEQLGQDAELLRQQGLSGSEGPRLGKQTGQAGPQRLKPLTAQQPQGMLEGQQLAASIGGAAGGGMGGGMPLL